jgi:RNA polymerase nonessential primary-like sigma factor
MRPPGRALSAERERLLLRRCRGSGDDSARRAAIAELWESHCDLAVAIARRYRQRNVDLTDLIGAGHLGIYTAIERFDPERFDNRLASYAVAWIRWHIQDYISRNAGPVRLPSSSGHRRLYQTAARLFAAAREACQREAVPASDFELCDRVGRRVGLAGDEVARSLRLIQGGRGEGDRDGRDGPGELPADALSPEDLAIARVDRAKLRRRILVLAADLLGERERMVFLARCMNDGEDVVRLEALARRLGVSRERVHQLEVSGRRKVMAALAAEGLAARPSERHRGGQAAGATAAGQAAIGSARLASRRM